jgi:hypothetical protein
MNNDALIGSFFAGIAIVSLLALLFFVGMSLGENNVRKRCDTYGKAKIVDVMYECKKVAT